MKISQKRSDSLPLFIEELQGESYHVFLKVRVNNKVCRFLLDTGASKTVLDETFVKEKIKNQHVDTLEQNTSSLHISVNESQITQIKSLELGACKVSNYMVAVIDLTHVNNTYAQLKRKPIQGILGSDILRDMKCVIDYGKAQMKVYRIPSK